VALLANKVQEEVERDAGGFVPKEKRRWASQNKSKERGEGIQQSLPEAGSKRRFWFAHHCTSFFRGIYSGAVETMARAEKT